MVCNRCIRVVKEDLEALGLIVKEIAMGEAEIESEEVIDKQQVAKVLKEAGFELLEDKNIKIVEKIKTIIIDLVQKASGEFKGNYSTYIAKQIGKDYQSLSTLFSTIENITIEKFIILQKIEKVKEWLIYDEYSISEMAFKLGYSSVPHLSSQFKQVTGFTPSEFKKLKSHQRSPLDKVHSEKKDK